MTFPILGGNGAGEEQYLIDNSLRFNNDDSAKLERTFSAGNQTDWTFSAWVKRGNFGGNQIIFGRQNVGDGANVGKIFFESNNKIKINNKVSDSTGFEATTNAVFRDVSAWYHIFISFDGNQSTHNDRAELYVNGVLQSWSGSGSLSAGNGHINLALAHAVGYRAGDGGEYFDGYIAEMYFIDGNSSLSHTDFGEFDEDSGIWKPIEYTGSFSGTNSFYLDFEDSGSLGADQSGNGNNFTPTNLASTDQTTDTPTNNFATLNPLANQLGTALSEGNLQQSDTGNDKNCFSTFGLNTGKWYFEVKAVSVGTRGNILITDADHNEGLGTNYARVQLYNGAVLTSATDNGDLSAFSNGDILCVALDLDNGQVWFSKNANIDTGTTALVTNLPLTGTNRDYRVSHFGTSTGTTVQFNFGNPPFSISSGNTDDNGYGNFEYAPPSGYLALCTQNLATELSPTIDDGSEYFNTVLYSGDGSSTQAITGVGFQPDFLWIKSRSNAESHLLVDSTRGSTLRLRSDTTNAEDDQGSFGIQSFDSDGFTAGDGDNNNGSGQTYASWNWLANGGTTSSNTDGSITSTVQANTTAGFSIVTYTGTGANATIGHSLGKVPKMIIVKRRNSTSNWGGYHESIGNTSTIKLNSSDASASNIVFWNNTSPTSSVFTVGTSTDLNASGGTYVAYCFADIEGYSKFGSYTGNGSSDGVFVYTGFKPAFVIYKRTNAVENWQVLDSKRDIDNPVGQQLYPNLSASEGTQNRLDFTSNGFKLRDGGAICNASGSTYIYMAFAENPFVSSTSIPVTAR